MVGNAKRIATLSYEETQELAKSGAKVLNAQGVEFAKEKGIAIYAVKLLHGTLSKTSPAQAGHYVRSS